ncbi:MAG TPA: hypothetical protein VKZ50_09450 [bacterium]|nr:hypothetical protein [bacterium]
MRKAAISFAAGINFVLSARWLLVGALLILCVNAQAADAPTLQAPTWMIGDTWTYQTPSGAQIVYTVLGAGNSGYTVRARLGNTPTGTLLVHPNLSTDKGYFIQIDWPLASGRSWGADQTEQANDETSTIKWHTTWLVKSWESVAVPAGTFDAYHVDGKQCAAIAARPCGNFSFWYAPTVKSFVKESWASENYWGRLAGRMEQLVSYTLHNPGPNGP